ncbi:MAG TPA: amidohydrolase family protein [Cyclobacteriaceae bacterium]
MRTHFLSTGIFLLLLLVSCKDRADKETATVTAFVGADIIDGTGSDPIRNGVLLISDGRVLSVGSVSQVEVPEGAGVIDVSGKTIIPGIINAHGHVGDVKGIEPGHYSAENIQDQLELYARYGVTTVVSLGDDGREAELFRAAVDTSASPGRARLYIAGTVVSGTTPEDAVAVVDENMRMGVDFMKIRVDDNLGSGTKMSEEVYRAVIDRSHEHGIRLAAHMYYLEDAKALLRSGADFIAHSVRDVAVDSSLIRLLKERNVCYCPTLTRDLSTFVYGEIPDFFEDPFFLREVDTTILQPLKDPQRRLQVRQSRSAQTYKQGLQRALKNLKTLSDSGVVIAFGTDSGVSGRFQGYFEHLEMELMAEAGLSPMEILTSATGSAARCLDLKDVGTLEPGKLADFVVLDKDPIADITNTRGISSVWIGGKSVMR